MDRLRPATPWPAQAQGRHRTWQMPRRPLHRLLQGSSPYAAQLARGNFVRSRVRTWRGREVHFSSPSSATAPHGATAGLARCSVTRCSDLSRLHACLRHGRDVPSDDVPFILQAMAASTAAHQGADCRTPLARYGAGCSTTRQAPRQPSSPSRAPSTGASAAASVSTSPVQAPANARSLERCGARPDAQHLGKVEQSTTCGALSFYATARLPRRRPRDLRPATPSSSAPPTSW